MEDNTGLGLIEEIIRKARKDAQFYSALKKLLHATDESVAAYLGKKIQIKDGILHSLSDDLPLVLKALIGKRLISQAEEVFKSFIGPRFFEFRLYKTGVATPKTFVKVDEVVSSSMLIDMFSALPGTWNQKWFSQDQEIEFCETYPKWLRHGLGATFFLTKKDETKPIDENRPYENLFVTKVAVDETGLIGADAHLLEDDFIWDDAVRYRIVSPRVSGDVKTVKDILSEVICSKFIFPDDEDFVIKEKFTYDNKEVKISFLDSRFQKWFGNKIEGPFSGSILQGRNLLKTSPDSQILEHLGDEKKAESTFREIYAMMQRQANGGRGHLKNNGWANMFYARDKEGILRLINVRWKNGGWEVYAFLIGNSYEQSAGLRYFSRRLDN